MAKSYGEWQILKSIGEGGQAHIYLAKNSNDDYGVVKRLKNINRKNRFAQEIKAIQNGNNGFFPKILAMDLDSASPYFVMEYFPKGCVTKEMIEQWNLKKKVRFYMKTMLAVSWANNEKVIHRDLKPENILVDEEDMPKISDFGICFLNEFGNRETLTEEAAGSFRYMAPELENGRTDMIGAHSDVYSLGKIAYWLFSNGKIYNRERHREKEFDLSKEIKASWVYYFNDFLDKATNPDISKRIQDVPNLIIEFGNVEKAIRRELRYLDLSIEQECSFCKNGKYEVVVDALNPISMQVVTKIKNFGFEPVGNCQWLIMVCDNCGNVQSFRKDLSKKWNWK